MTFLNPLVLLGLVAAAIPLIIHLFNFRRPKRVDFSSLAFLKELQKSTMQRVRIKQWLLLALRTLALACLILAFARPTLQGGLAESLGGRTRASVAIVVDNSLSMTLRDEQGELLAQARAAAARIVEQSRDGDELYVLPVAGRGEARPTPFTNRGPALEAIRELAPAAGARTLARAAAEAAAVLGEGRSLNREVYLISDLQKSTFVDSVRTAVPEGTRLVLVPVGDRIHPNVAVVEARVESRIVEVGQPARIHAVLANYGTQPLDGYVASLFLEGERVAQAAADLAPGARTPLQFTVTPQRRGWLSGLVRIEDDAFGYDNERFFALHVPERRGLLVARGEGQATDYLALALSPDLTQGRVAFDLKTIPENALAATNLGAYGAVVLAGVRDLSSGEVASLARYVQEGGGLLLLPGAREAGSYDALLQALGGGRFAGFTGTPGGEQPVASFDRVDLEHPLFEGVFDRAGGREVRVESPAIYYAARYVPGGGDEQTLIRMSDGAPFLQEIRHGRGAAFAMAVAPERAWSDLPVRGLFIPLLYRTMFYLSSGEPGGGAGLTIGRPGTLRIPGVAGTPPLQLVAPDGEAYTPEQRNLFGAVLLETDAAVRAPGVYDVRQGETLVSRVAVNAAGQESDLQVLSAGDAEEGLEEATGAPVHTIDVRDEGVSGAIARALSEERFGVELWNVFLLLALLFLIAEMLVARQWRPEPVGA